MYIRMPDDIKDPCIARHILYTTTKVPMFHKSLCIFICTKIIQFHHSEITLFLISQHIFINDDKSTDISFICMYFHIPDDITLKIFIYKQIRGNNEIFITPYIHIHCYISQSSTISLHM